jgi:translation initiation factor 5B
MPKKDKKKAKQQDDYWDTDFQNDITESHAATTTEPPPPQPPTAEENDGKDPMMDDLADEFGGLMATLKRNKAKKGKKQQQVEMVDDNPELEAVNELEQPQEPKAMSTAVSAAVEGDKAPAAEGEEDAGEFRVKTKKEKEKEKKEKEKAKKKAQVPL